MRSVVGIFVVEGKKISTSYVCLVRPFLFLELFLSRPGEGGGAREINTIYACSI